MEPAAERLEADHAHIARPDQRLEIGLDVAVLDRAAQLLAQDHAALARVAELLGEMAAAAAPLGLGVIERKVGVLQQVLGIVGVVGIDRDADRGARGQGFLADLDRPIEQAAQLLPDQARFERVVDLAHDDEFVAAKPRDQRIGRHFEFQLLRHDAQDLVADHVAMDVVDVLEVVEIDPDHRERGAGGVRVLHRLGEPRAHQLAVRQRGERIVVRQERHARLRVLAFADVAEFEQARAAVAIRDGAGRDLDRDGRAGAIGEVGVEAQFALAKQAIDHVGVGDERRDHQMRGVLALDADQPAQAGVDRDGLHPGAHRDALVEHVEQRVEAARLVGRLARRGAAAW